MKGKITAAQKRKIYALTNDMSEVQFKAIFDSTSHSAREIVQKGKKNRVQTKSQMIAGLNKRTASEMIDILESRSQDDVKGAYEWLARNEHKLQPHTMKYSGMDNSKKQGKDPMNSAAIDRLFGVKK